MRLFIGAGMPRGLWRRVDRRFAPAQRARVLRVDRGRGDPRQPQRRQARLQGPAAARAAPRSGSPPTTSPRAGCASAPTASRSSASPGEVGMLLTRLRGVVSTSESPLRGVFEPGDAWLATGDLFRADEDGDLWLVDHVAALIRTEHGYVGLVSDPRRARRPRRGRPRGRLRRAERRSRRVARRSPPSPCAPGCELDAEPRSPARSATLDDAEQPGPRPRRRRDPGDHLVPAERRGAARRRGPAGDGVGAARATRTCGARRADTIRAPTT